MVAPSCAGVLALPCQEVSQEQSQLLMLSFTHFQLVVFVDKGGGGAADNPGGKGRALLASLGGVVFPWKSGSEESTSATHIPALGEVSGGTGGMVSR